MKTKQEINKQRIKHSNSKEMFISALIIAMFSVSTAGAEEKQQVTEKPPQKEVSINRYTIFGIPLLSADESLTLGLGVGYSTSPFKGVDDGFCAFPEIMYQNGNFFIGTSGIGYSIFSRENYEFTLLGSWRTSEYDSDDSKYLNGMEKRNFVIEGGAAFTMETFVGGIGVTVMSDVTNNHKGQSITAEYSFPIGGESWIIEPVAGVHWQSSKMVDYYYGVRNSEVREDRAAYSGDSTLNPFIALNCAYEIFGNVLIEGSISYEFLGNGITNSPLIDDDNIVSGAIMLSYSL